MNESLAARRAELEIERDGQGIAPGASEPDPDTAREVPTPLNFVHNGEPAVLDLNRYSGQAEAVAPEQSSSELVQREAAWRKSMQLPGAHALSEADVRSSDTVMGLRGEDHAVWLVATNDKSPEAMAMISSYMENDSYRDAFKGAIENFYEQSQKSPESLQSLDEATDFVVPLVNEIENRKHAASLAADGRPDVAKQVNDRKIIQGELIDHGAAPYQNQPDKEPSYFVTVKTDAGNRTLWGAGLADAMQQVDLKQGDRVRIEDKGTVPVTLQLPQSDGSITEKPGYRRKWDVAQVMPAMPEFMNNGERATLDLHRFEQQEQQGKATPTPAPATPAKAEPEQDHGPEMD